LGTSTGAPSVGNPDKEPDRTPSYRYLSDDRLAAGGGFDEARRAHFTQETPP